MSNSQSIAAKLMVSTSMTQREIAQKLDVREETVSRWKKSSEFQRKLKEEQDKYLNDLTAPAMRTIRDLLNSHSDYVRLQAAQDILDRTGYKPTDKVEQTNKNIEVTIGDYDDD